MTPRAIAAGLTPLRADGAELDLDVVEPYVAFLRAAGIDGVLALGTAGEGILLTVPERKAVVEAYVAASLPVLAHCGAQSTADTILLAEHAAATGVAGIAVIGPPYFRLDAPAMLAHFAAAARACAPTPFYVYEFENVSGYAVPVEVIDQLRELAPNLAGLKVSDTPFAKVQPYLREGLEVFVGAEALLGEGLAAGAAGGVSALAAGFPDVVVDAVRTGDSQAAGALRATLERFPRHAALKAVVAAKGVPIRDDVRRPLRGLTTDERRELLAAVGLQ